MSHFTPTARCAPRATALLAAALLSFTATGSAAAQPPSGHLAMLAQPRSVPNFKLTDHAGRPFTLANLKNRWTLVFNGQSNCAVLCPKALRFMDALQLRIGAGARAPGLVLVTSARGLNTPEQLKRYVTGFNPQVTGVTGVPVEVDRLYHGLSSVEAMPVSERGAPDVAPTMAVVSPDGLVVAQFSAPQDVEQVMEELAALTGRP